MEFDILENTVVVASSVGMCKSGFNFGQRHELREGEVVFVLTFFCNIAAILGFFVESFARCKALTVVIGGPACFFLNGF